MASTIPHTKSEDAEIDEDGTEARMRQALGKLGSTGQAKQNAIPQRRPQQTAPGFPRHRFKQDGHVPVIRLALPQGEHRKERAAAAPGLEAKSRSEHPGSGLGQISGESARAVQELTDQLRAVQTRFGHAELALAEASKAARASQEEAAALRHALEESEAQLAQVRVELTESEQSRETLEHQLEAARHTVLAAGETQTSPVRRKPGRPLGSTKLARSQDQAHEPTPVKWWAGD